MGHSNIEQEGHLLDTSGYCGIFPTETKIDQHLRLYKKQNTHELPILLLDQEDEGNNQAWLELCSYWRYSLHARKPICMCPTFDFCMFKQQF